MEKIGAGGGGREKAREGKGEERRGEERRGEERRGEERTMPEIQTHAASPKITIGHDM